MASQQDQQQSQQSSPNTNYHDYMSRFKKEEEYFRKAVMSNGKQWPRIKPVEQRVYENWIAQVVDPVSGEYHTDANGKTARYVVDKIVRIRLVDGSEKLYSSGQLIGYNSFKDKKTYPCDQPEVHRKTNFDYKTTLDNKNGQIKRVTTGPSSVEDVYDLPFTPENADKLWSMRKDRSIKLTVKDELSGEPRAVEVKGGRLDQSNLDAAFELFKSAPFEYVYNWEYVKNPTATSTTTQQTAVKEIQDEGSIKKAIPDPTPNTKTKFNEPEKVK